MVLNALLGILGVWLLAVTVFSVWFYTKIARLVKKSKGENLVKTLEKIVAKEAENTKEIAGIKKNIEEIRDSDLKHIQKIGIVRFNPFNETGGDHSFSLALLDGVDTGIVLTGLHTRERTRLYTKRVTKGKSEHTLSKEEGEALEKARRK